MIEAICFDFETYSEAGFRIGDGGKVSPQVPGKKGGLKLVGTGAYVRHPSTDITALTYALPGESVELWFPGLPPPAKLLRMVSQGVPVKAHKALFDFEIWNKVGVTRYGFPELRLQQVHCTAAKAMKAGLPPSLDGALEALGMPGKDKDGKAAMHRLCRPQSTTGKRDHVRILYEDEPDTWERMWRYAVIDTVRLRELDHALPDLSEHDRAWWLQEARMLLRGVRVDLELCEAGIRLSDEHKRSLDAELQRVTGVDSSTKTAKLLEWCGGQISSLAKGADLDGASAQVKRVFALRAEAAGGSTGKFRAFLLQTDVDSRFRHGYTWHGSHPGRHTGGGPQLANLPRGELGLLHWCPECGAASLEECEEHPGAGSKHKWDEAIQEHAVHDLKTLPLWEIQRKWRVPVQKLLAACIRGCVVASPGHDLVCTDYTAIQAVVLSALAGEEWRLEVFRTHGQIYLASAARMTGKTVEYYLEYKERMETDHPDRRIGKQGELLLQFQGSIGAMRRAGATGSDEELLWQVQAWRNANPKIVAFWKLLENAAVRALLCRGRVIQAGPLAYEWWSGRLLLHLPSGRRVVYHDPQLTESGTGGRYSLSYMRYNTNPKKGAFGWRREDTFGGRLTENAVMGTEVDIVTHTKSHLESAGYYPVMETYDEVVAEVAEGQGSVEEFERLLLQVPKYCEDWPIKCAGGFRAKRYLNH